MYIAVVSCGCCKSRLGDVAHIAYVAIVSEAYCKRIFRVFQMFQRYVSSMFSGRMLQVCLSGRCIYFTHTLHVFYLDVAYGCNGFKCVLVVFFKCFISMFCFNCLQMYITTVVFGCLKSRSGVALSSSHLLLHLAVGSRGAGAW